MRRRASSPGATFELIASCTNGATTRSTLGVGETGSTPDIPVGTSCTVTETGPAGGLIDSSFAWGPTPAPQTVTITASGQVVAVTMTNTVVRVTGTLTITKAPITPGGVVDPARTFSIDFSCVYGEDPPVTGTVTLTAGATASTPPLFLGSRCTVTEDPADAADAARRRRPVVGVAAGHLRPGPARRGRLGDDTRVGHRRQLDPPAHRLVQRHQGGSSARARPAATTAARSTSR